MSKKKFLILAPLIGGHFLYAQTDSTVKQLDEVVVTASKAPLKESETGKVIVTISHDQIQKSAAKTLGQLLNEQAGVSVNGSLNAAGTNQSIYIRGGASGTTLVLIDGIPVYDPSIVDNSFDLNLVPLGNIERIEICKGAQSTLYGSDAIAGVINIITTKENIQKPLNLNATLGGGSYGTILGQAQLYGKLGSGFTYNLRYSKYKTDGFPTAYDSTGKGNFSNDGYNGDVVSGNFAWNACSRLTLKGFVQYSRYLADLDAGAFTNAEDYTNTSKSLMLGGSAEYKLGGTHFTAHYQYSTYDRQLLEDSVDGQSYYSDQYFGKTQYVELFATSKLGHGFTWLNGGDYRFASMDEHSNYGDFNDTSMKQASAYSSLFYSHASGLNAELGGRFNANSRYGTNFTYTFNPSYVLNDRWKLYGSLSTGFKAPTLYELYSSYGNKDLQPETSSNFEGGLQYSSKILDSRVTYFDRKINEGLDFNYVTYLYYNYTEQQAEGIEWENRWQITKILSLTANYTWTHIRDQTQSHITYDDTTYDYALRVPEHMINATLGLHATKNWFISASAHYESKRYDLGGYNPVTYDPLPDAALSSFVIFNAYSEHYLKKSLKVFVDAKNITNKKFFTIYGYNSIPFLINGGVSVSL